MGARRESPSETTRQAQARDEETHRHDQGRDAARGGEAVQGAPVPASPLSSLAVAATAHSSPGGFDALVFATSPLRDIASAGLATPTSRAGGKVDFSPVFDFGGGGS